MKNILENLKNFIIIVYILLIIFVTICLLSYNEYKVTVFGQNTLIPIIDEDLEPNYTVGDLVIAKRKGIEKVETGDQIFFYKTTYGITTINFAKVVKSEQVTETEFTYTVDGDYRFSSEYFIGETSDATVIPKVGTILSLLQSKWGFLFLGVFPSLVAFLYTLHNVVVEVQEVKEEPVKPINNENEDPVVEVVSPDNQVEEAVAGASLQNNGFVEDMQATIGVVKEKIEDGQKGNLTNIDSEELISMLENI